jgi:hypothetical protein
MTLCEVNAQARSVQQAQAMPVDTSLVQHLRNIARTTTITTAATSAAVTALAKADTHHAAAALNAVSHILWGDDAAKVDDWDVRHTLVGSAINGSAMGAWSILHEALPRAHTWWGAALKGVLLSATAYVVDYHVVPKRLTPGFERRLSASSMLVTYGVLAGAFAYSEHAAAAAGACKGARSN